NLIGFLAGTVDLSEVQRLSNYSRIGASGQAVVVDRRGRVIAHPREDWRVEAKDLSSSAIFQQSLGQETGVSWYTDLDGNVPRALRRQGVAGASAHLQSDGPPAQWRLSDARGQGLPTNVRTAGGQPGTCPSQQAEVGVPGQRLARAPHPAVRHHRLLADPSRR